ncbi:MAG TPA: transketolase family protein [Candidatus Onthomorpha intestinigallinarum]|uniref:Transketolase family protein n=1 Tax=Candidatus Onthomorpha intestinigallinarum TaxID=2840880 RepID=A0A9D1UHX8_9BACT|nr:transketolase family protein [Candidatus Onthomorpha intestinigallinarum]
MKEYQLLGKKDTRSGFGAGLLEAGRRNKNVVALCADLIGSVKMDSFYKEFPDRTIQCGIAEADMIGIAAGLALSGKVAFAASFAAFATGRVYDQIRQAVAYSDTNVKIAGSHAGVTLGEDGATHQILEDIGLMKMLPNMAVLNPCDYNQTKAATIAAAEYRGPVYIRFGRPSVPMFIPEDMPFEIGKALLLSEGKDVSLVATGHLVWEALEAARLLEKEGISAEVIDIHTIKPLDGEAILRSARKTGCVVGCEEHQFNGGLNESIAQLLVRNEPVPMEFIGVDDVFGQSGKPDELMVKYNLKAENIAATAKKAISRKK